MVAPDSATNHDIIIPPLTSLEEALAIYCLQVYVYCRYNLKQTALVLDITEKQLISFLKDDLDFS